MLIFVLILKNFKGLIFSPHHVTSICALNTMQHIFAVMHCARMKWC